MRSAFLGILCALVCFIPGVYLQGKTNSGTTVNRGSHENDGWNTGVAQEYDILRQKVEIQSLNDKNVERNGYSLKRLINIAKKRNYQIRANAEKVYRARQNIKLAISALLPSLNMSTILSPFEFGLGGVAVESFTDIAASSLGFLFPSNWFRWKESKLYHEAERYGYGVLIANQINAMESQYYYVHLLQSMNREYVNYISLLNSVVEKVKLRVESGEALFDGLARLENLLTIVKQDHLLIFKTMKEAQYSLSFGAGLGYQEWSGFEVESIDLPDLKLIDSEESETYESRVIEKSLELKQLDYMILGTQYAQKTRAFDFLTPGSNTSAALGFGYPAYLKIGKSNSRELEVKREEMVANLQLTLKKAVVSYNNTIPFFRESMQGYSNSKVLVNFIVRKFEEGGVFEGAELVEAIGSELQFMINSLEAQHRYLISLAQIKRVSYSGSYYKKIMSMVPDVKKRKLGLCKKFEDQKIKREIKKGRLKL